MRAASRLVGLPLVLVGLLPGPPTNKENPHPTLTLDHSTVGAGASVRADGAEFYWCYPLGEEGISSGDHPPSSSLPPSSSSDPKRPENVEFTLDPGGSTLGSIRPHEDGTFHQTLRIPSTLPAGAYQVVANCDGVDVNGARATADLTVTAAPSRPPPPPSPPPPSPPLPGEVHTPTANPNPTGTGPIPTPDTISLTPPTVVPSPRSESSRSEPGVPGWAVVLAVVAGLIGLSALGRRLARSRSAERSPAQPVVHAVAGPTTRGPVRLRETGPEQSVAVRVVVIPGPEPVVRIKTGRRE